MKIFLSVLLSISAYAAKLQESSIDYLEYVAPRLIIHIEGGFEQERKTLAKDLSRALSLLYITDNDHLSEKYRLDVLILDLEKRSKNRSIILDAAVFDDTWIKELYYDSLKVHIETPLSSIIDTIRARRASLPLTSNDLRRVDRATQEKLYALYANVQQVLEEHQIFYIGACGTVLGAARHEGLIPWDDDLDLFVKAEDWHRLINAKEDFEKLGFVLLEHQGYIKIFPADGRTVQKETEYPWKHPWMDIFGLEKFGDRWTYNVPRLMIAFGQKDYFTLEDMELSPIMLSFGPYQLPVVRRYQNYLDRLYGSDWNIHAYDEYEHVSETRRTPIKVDIIPSILK